MILSSSNGAEAENVNGFTSNMNVVHHGCGRKREKKMRLEMSRTPWGPKLNGKHKEGWKKLMVEKQIGREGDCLLM